MWVFYIGSLPLTLGMVTVTLRYFAGPHVPRYVFCTVGYAWFCSISVIILVPADIWTTIVGHDKGGVAFFWSWSYWSTFALTWAVAPIIQGYEDAGDFTVTERLKTSLRANLMFYMIVGSVGLFGLILLIIMHGNWSGGIVGFAMGCSNTFGLVTGAFLLGFGLSEIPKSIWRNADWSNRQKFLSYRVAKMAVNLDNAHQEFSNVIVIVQATSKQMSKRDFLRPYMDVIDSMLLQMMHEDPSFKPAGGRFGENDMDYDTDDKTMAKLRRRLRKAWEEYYRYRSEYMTNVLEALELEDTVKSCELRKSTGWRYVSSLRGTRTSKLGSFLDTTELLWRCILRKQLEKLWAIILGCMSAAILLAEAAILPSGVDLSFFSILINAVGKHEILVQTNSVSLLMICSMIARYAPSISYNFLNLISLRGNAKTVFEERMGNIDDAVPFFGKGFNKIYPLIMVIYTILVAGNFFGRVIDYLGNWIKFKIENEEQEMDGFDPSGVIILQKERSWLQQGHKIGEQVLPLARNFYDRYEDVETANTQMDKDTSQKEIITLSRKESKRKNQPQLLKEDEQVMNSTFHDDANNTTSKGITSSWASVKAGFQNFKANRFLPLHNFQENYMQNESSSESLEDIFDRLRQNRHRNYMDKSDFDDDCDDIIISRPT